jgi:hypothetical protein
MQPESEFPHLDLILAHSSGYWLARKPQGSPAKPLPQSVARRERFVNMQRAMETVHDHFR